MSDSGRSWTYAAADSVRVDKFLARENEQWSRSLIQHWLTDGCIQVNGQTVKANYKLKPNDHIVLQLPDLIEPEINPEAMSLNIVYEDEHLIVINKPKGLVVHPAPGHYTGTLVNGLLAHCHDLSGINGVLRPGIVHRIDKDTSGLLVVAKHDEAHSSLAEQLREHTVERKYVALVNGHVEHASGTINAPIGRHPERRQDMAVIAGGKDAVTHFKVLEHFQGFTLVKLKLETGRTHQIRVHMHYIGHPLVGDPKYGPPTDLPVQGQALHAQVLGFIHPVTGTPLRFEAPLPAELEQLISQLQREQRR